MSIAGTVSHNRCSTENNGETPYPHGASTCPDSQAQSPDASPVVIRNYTQTQTTTDGVPSLVAVPKPLNRVIDEIHDVTGGWPRRVGSVMFVDDASGLRWFDRDGRAGLFAWLRSRFKVDWKRGGNFVSNAELFSQLSHVAKQYDAIELLPHEPPIDNIYYRCKAPKPGDGTYLKKLLDRFRPETDLDRDLIQAAIMTVFWGGPPGMRPTFVITSDDGRGVGKSKVADVISYLAGGSLDVDAGCDISELKQRLLSPDGQTKRVAVLDNVKSLRFSWAELEKLITSRDISGKQMYIGEGRRPNLLTWLMTLNGVSLGDDMAQRSIVIKLVRGENSGTWYEETIRFIDEHREQIIGDVIAALQADRNPLDKYSRWASWEHDVLSRLPQPNATQSLILERQTEANCELDEADLIEEHFAERLRAYGYDSANDVVHIPSIIAAEWLGRATGEKVRTGAASKKLAQLSSEKRGQSDEGKLTRIKPNPSRARGRGFLWIGEMAASDKGACYDLDDRVKSSTGFRHASSGVGRF